MTRVLLAALLLSGIAAAPAFAQGVGGGAARTLAPGDVLTYVERGSLARDRSWVDRVQMATTAAALQALTVDPQTEGFAKGVALSRYYLQQQEYVSVRVAWMVLVSDGVTPFISDADLTALLVSRWPSYAAVLVP